MATRLPGLAHLQEIGAAFYAGARSRDEARSDVIDVIAGQVQCSRVSLWRFDGTPGALKLLCLASKVTGAELVTSEHSLHEAEYRDYFDALVRTGMYVGHDTMHDPHLQPMRESYCCRAACCRCSTPRSPSTGGLTAWCAASRPTGAASGVPKKSAICVRSSPNWPC